MSQVNVEKIIGLLATDEAIRRRFSEDPQAVLAELAERGVELNPCERWSLARLDPKDLARFAEAIEPRLQKADLKGGADQ
jgi:hypothetical protein